jgi:hypothetical protein
MNRVFHNLHWEIYVDGYDITYNSKKNKHYVWLFKVVNHSGGQSWHYRLPCINDENNFPSMKWVYKYRSRRTINHGYFVKAEEEFPKYILSKLEHFWRGRRLLR